MPNYGNEQDATSDPSTITQAEPKTPRMQTESLAELQLLQDTAPWLLRTTSEIRKGLSQASDKAEELMAIFNLLTSKKTVEDLNSLSLVAGDGAFKQFREGWKNFIILEKTHQLFTEQAEQLQQVDSGQTPKSPELPYYSVEIIEKLEIEQERGSRQIIDHTARLAKTSLHAARQWYDDHMMRFHANLEQDKRDYIAQHKEEKFGQPVEGIPSLRALCQRKLEQQQDSRIWCTLFNTEPVQPEREHAPPRSEIEIPPSIDDEQGRQTDDYIGSSMRS
ncbi:hypothetical protein BN59_02044 [Legionella massiliensis]|uniref:Uncharacterized protein n=1 Tax=Legionella massiliensis TaxID=1034943 RepID=A0A078L141_9GAMM|nr:hypothetical protein [Legionella massiliensis]CDZ77754.1 hypothetical protein BN59_02044 [Legionella massiliensis]CEE13492.1 hypothetical protein BN1094_02044 [Legionella massiliensis]